MKRSWPGPVVREYSNILVVQTAFPGDVILTLPLVQALKRSMPSATIDMLVIPRAAEVLAHHPALHNILIYDKKKSDRGVGGFIAQVRRIRSRRYDLAIVPHRSMRSAALVRLGGIPYRVGFHTSAGSFLCNTNIQYDTSLHEVDRNLSLLSAIGITNVPREFPNVYPSNADIERVNTLLSSYSINGSRPLVGVAPGTVWNTKRWLPERFKALIAKLVQAGNNVVLIGGKEDEELCSSMKQSIGSPYVFSTAGELSMLQSAEVIRRNRLLVCNDSAPMHLAVAMRTPVIAIFGATVPRFGFAPYGTHDRVVEINGLPCRPCSIHGGEKCPITTFDCMNNISAETVYQQVVKVMEQAH